MSGNGTIDEQDEHVTQEAQTMGNAATSAEHAGLTENTRLAIPLGLALIAGAFVTLGIQGDLLSRLMRNSPNKVIAAFALGVVGVVVPLFALLWRNKARVAAFAAGGVLLLLGTVVAIWAAVSGTGIREQPTVTVVAKAETTTPITTPSRTQTTAGAESGSGRPGPTSESWSTVLITATGLSLASNDRMLLRVIAFEPTIAVDDARIKCSTTVMADVDQKAGKVLFWGEAGPTAAGSGSSSVTLSVSQTAYRYLCAHAVLSARPGTDGSAGSFTTTLVDIRSLEPLPAA